MKVDKMDLLETYVRIAELRSLTKAAKELNVAPATISRKLTKLEETIGQTLVRRTTHDISLTKFGDMFLRDAKELILGWLELKYRYHDIDQATMGPLVVVAPACIGHELLTDIAIEFRMSNPGVELFWNLQNESVNFSNMGCHLWLSLGNDIGKNQIRRKIAISKCSLVAAPVCVQGTRLRGPASVERLPCVSFNTKGAEAIELTSQSSHSSITIYPEIAFSTNSISALHKALLKGIGFSSLPDWIVQKDIESGRLIEIIPEWTPASQMLYAVTSVSSHQNPHIDEFIKILLSRLLDVPYLRLISEKPADSIL